MSTIITFPNNTEEVIDAIRGAIGRETEWHVVASSIACPICEYDPVTDTSTDSFCVYCSGVYWTKVWEVNTLSGHVTWGFSEQLGWMTGGQLAEGECRVQVKYTPENVTIVDNAEKIFVDGKEMQFIKKTLRGVPEINRILVDLKEREDGNG